MLGSLPPLNPTKSLSSLSGATSSSSSKHDELMDVGIEFMANKDTPPSRPMPVDSAASQLPPDGTATQQVFSAGLFNGVAGAALASSFVLSNSVPIYLSTYVCLQDVLVQLSCRLQQTKNTI